MKLAFLAPRQTTLYSSNKLASSTVLLLYVDNIIVTGCSSLAIDQVVSAPTSP